MGIVVGPFFFGVVYPILPWIGVMLLGFGLARVFQHPPSTRDRQLLTGGLTATTLFFVLRGASLYGDPNPWQTQANTVATVMDFMNITKYPPSLLFLLATLGPAAIFCSRAARVPDAVRRVLTTYGRAPFAFYIAHFYLIHTISIVLGVLQGFRASQFFTLSFLFPMGYGLGLPGVYAVWLLVVASLYPLCTWVGAVKARRRDWWLSYL
jgi:uncharacterized membrane protein